MLKKSAYINEHGLSQIKLEDQETLNTKNQLTSILNLHLSNIEKDHIPWIENLSPSLHSKTGLHIKRYAPSLWLIDSELRWSKLVDNSKSI